MNQRIGDVQKIRSLLFSFLENFEKYTWEINNAYRPEVLRDLRIQLQREEPRITDLVTKIIGNESISTGRRLHSTYDIISTALGGGNNEAPLNFNDYGPGVSNLLNRSIGKIDSGLWPPLLTEPVLVIRDETLKERCLNQLRSGPYDTVIREATLVLEDRIRNKVPQEILTRLIPVSGDQNGERLVDKLLLPENPVIIISEDRTRRIAFFKILKGVIAFLRNPYHHTLDDLTERSWAWSTVGLIDTLLFQIEQGAVSQTESQIS